MVHDSQDTYKRAFDQAIKLLSIRLHTIEELRRKLTLRKYEKHDIDKVLERLVELKVLNDEQFAGIFLDNLIRYKAYGFYGLKMKLLQRGISGEIAEKLLSENLDIEKETKIAEKLSGKFDDKQKLADSLKRKGFRSEVIFRVTKN